MNTTDTNLKPGNVLVNALAQQQEFVDRVNNDDLESFHLINGAIAGLEKVGKSKEITNEQRAFAQMALAKAFLCKGAAERRIGNNATAQKSYESASRILDDSKSNVFAPQEKRGLKKWLGLGKPEPNQELVDDWNCTKGGLLMNLGVLQNTSGDPKSALETWKGAEHHLFGEFIRQVGPLQDLEATSKTFNLWQNMMESAMNLGEFQLAAKMVENMFKLQSFWPAHDLETPEIVTDAVADFLCSIRDSSDEHRNRLVKEMPAELSDLVSSILDGTE